MTDRPGKACNLTVLYLEITLAQIIYSFLFASDRLNDRKPYVSWRKVILSQYGSVHAQTSQPWFSLNAYPEHCQLFEGSGYPRVNSGLLQNKFSTSLGPSMSLYVALHVCRTQNYRGTENSSPRLWWVDTTGVWLLSWSHEGHGWGYSLVCEDDHLQRRDRVHSASEGGVLFATALTHSVTLIIPYCRDSFTWHMLSLNIYCHISLIMHFKSSICKGCVYRTADWWKGALTY